MPYQNVMYGPKKKRFTFDWKRIPFPSVHLLEHLYHTINPTEGKISTHLTAFFSDEPRYPCKEVGPMLNLLCFLLKLWASH